MSNPRQVIGSRQLSNRSTGSSRTSQNSYASGSYSSIGSMGSLASKMGSKFRSKLGSHSNRRDVEFSFFIRQKEVWYSLLLYLDKTYKCMLCCYCFYGIKNPYFCDVFFSKIAVKFCLLAAYCSVVSSGIFT